MAGNIKGITIEIAGNVGPLNKALDDVNQTTRGLSSELRQVEKLLKLDPGNVDLLAQKQKLLAEQVDNSREKLDRLRAAQEQVQRQFESGEIGAEQYRAFQREVIAAEQQLQRFEGQLSEANSGLGETGSSAQSAGRNFREMGDNIQATGEKVQGLGEKFAPASAGAAGMLAGLVANAEATREYRADMGKLEAAFTTAGFTAEQAKGVYADFYGILGESDTAQEAVNHLAELCDTESELNDWTTIATGVYAKFGDSLPLEGLTEAANETAKVGAVTGPLADALNWAGVSEDAFNDSLAACSSEQERQQLITSTLNGLYGEAAGKYREVNADVIAANDAQGKLTESMANLGAIVEPIVTVLKEKVAGLVNKFVEMDPAIQTAIVAVVGIVAAIGPLLIAIGAAVTGFGSIVGVMGSVGGAVTALIPKLASLILGMGPIGLAIAAVVAAGVLLWKNWDTIKAKAQELWTKLTKVWEGIKTSVSRAFENVKTTIAEAWDAVKAKTVEIWDAIKRFLADWWPVLLGALTGPIGLVVGLVVKNWDTVKAKTEEIWNDLKTFAFGIWDGLKTKVTEIFEAIRSFVDVKWTAVKTKTEAIWNNLKSFLTGIWDALKTKVDSIFEAIRSFIDTKWAAVKQKTDEIWNAVKTFLTGIWDNLKTKVSEIWEAIRSFIDEKWSAIKSKTDEIWNAVKTFLSTTWSSIKTDVTTKVTEIWTAVTTKFSEMKQAVADKMIEVKTTVVNKWNEAKTFLENINLLQIGKDILQGLINGIHAKIEALKNKIQDVTSAITGKIRSLLGIQSPSTVMQEVGHYTIDGLILGIADKDADVKTAMAGVVTAVTSVASDMVNAGASLGQSFSQALQANIIMADVGGEAAKLAGTQNTNYGFEPLLDASEKPNPYAVWNPLGNYVDGIYYPPQWATYGGPSVGYEATPALNERGESTGGIDIDYESPVLATPVLNEWGESTGRLKLEYLHDGGWVGQGLKSNEVPKILELGEFVLSRDMLKNIANFGNRVIPTQSMNREIHLHIENKGTIVGRNGMDEFAKTVSRQISRDFGLSLGGAW